MTDEQAHGVRTGALITGARAAGSRHDGTIAPLMDASRAHGVTDATLRLFVLGALDDRERLEIEERLISEPAMLEQLELAQGRLAAAYVDGELSPDDRQRFERHCLTTTERCRQVTVLRLVRDRARIGVRERHTPGPAGPEAPVVSRSVPRDPSAWTLAVAGLVCLTVAGAAGLTVRLVSLQRQLAVVHQQHADQQRAVSEMSMEVARLSARAVELEAVASAPFARVPLEAAPASAGGPEYELHSGALRRGGAMVRVVVPAGAPLVRFRMRVANAVFPAYRAAIVDARGVERWSISALVPDTVDGALVLRVVSPSELLVAGEYEVRITGLAADGHDQPIGAYPFRRPS